MDLFRKENLNWQNDESYVCAPHSSHVDEIRDIFRLIRSAPSLSRHLWVSSSGSSQRAGESLKWIALSKEAFLASADASNAHLLSSKDDCWGIVLPLSHVGGVSILARSYLAQSRNEFYFEERATWDAPFFHDWVKRKSVTLLSLVPTQIYDLCSKKLIAPPSVRAVLVGGGALSPELYQVARDLGWPCLPTFGMTECCSQIATANLTSLLCETFPPLHLLSHVEARTNGAEGLLALKSESLLTGFVQEKAGVSSFTEPTRDGWYQTSDRATLIDSQDGLILQPLGREGQWAKIKGYNVFLPALRENLNSFLKAHGVDEFDWIVGFREHERDGARVVFIHQLAAQVQIGQLLNVWNQGATTFPGISETQFQNPLPRTSLGKDKIWL